MGGKVPMWHCQGGKRRIEMGYNSWGQHALGKIFVNGGLMLCASNRAFFFCLVLFLYLFVSFFACFASYEARVKLNCFFFLCLD